MNFEIVWLIGLIFFIWLLIDIFTKQKRMPMLHKILWIVAGFFFNIVTAIVYFFVVKKGKL